MFNWQIENFLNPVNTIITVISLIVIYLVFLVIFTLEKKEFVDLFDASFSLFEQELLKKWGQYFFWALIQQSILLIPMYFIEVGDQWKYLISALIFGCLFHLPNWRLMAFTTLFGGIFYGLWFFSGYQSLVYLALLHGFGGTCFYKMGWEMRVWRFDGSL